MNTIGPLYLALVAALLLPSLAAAQSTTPSGSSNPCAGSTQLSAAVALSDALCVVTGGTAPGLQGVLTYVQQ